MLSGVEQSITVTLFNDFSASTKTEATFYLGTLAERIRTTSSARKGALPWLKLARFGENRTDKNSLRNDANVLAITGVEADYDGEKVGVAEAVERLTKAGILAMVYTSPSHTEDTPRWRVLCPTSEPLPPARRENLMGRLNGLFGGIFSTESWTLSQAYYFGSVNRNPSHEVHLIDGQPIDEHDDLDEIWRGKPATISVPSVNGERSVQWIDEAALLGEITSGVSYHMAVVRLLGRWARTGVAFMDARQRLLSVFEAVPDEMRDGRWQTRYGDIDRCLEDIYGAEARQKDQGKRDAPIPEPPPGESDDPGWWHSLEQNLLENQGVANKEEEPEPSFPASSPASSPDTRDGLIINPPIHWTAPAPLRQWLIQDWIPIGYVTGLYGDGGVGKSLIAQQLLCSVALGLPWLGMDVRPGRAFGFMCEDDASELHRRQEGINRAYGVEMLNLENLRIAARLGFDNLLMTFDADNRGKPTGIFAEICEYLDKFRPRVVVLDTLADIFGGREIERTHARQFVQGIGGNIARRYECAVVIPAHPSASGLSTGSGTSGSTAWNNTFRSRLYITRPEDDDQGDTRLVSRMKSNYAPKGGEITASWDNGAFTTGTPIRPRPEIEWHHIEAIFQEIDRAWKDGDPWSSEPQAKRQSRYIATWASIKLGLDEKKVGRIVQKWCIEKYLRTEVVNAKNHHRGLRVLRWLQP